MNAFEQRTVDAPVPSLECFSIRYAFDISSTHPHGIVNKRNKRQQHSVGAFHPYGSIARPAPAVEKRNRKRIDTYTTTNLCLSSANKLKMNFIS